MLLQKKHRFASEIQFEPTFAILQGTLLRQVLAESGKTLWTKPEKIVNLRRNEIPSVFAIAFIVFVRLHEQRRKTCESVCTKSADSSAAQHFFQSGVVPRSNAGGFRSPSTGNDISDGGGIANAASSVPCRFLPAAFHEC